MTGYSDSEHAVIMAALDEFSRHGRQGARMQEIANRAGVNKALLHYYFRSKDRLYEEVFRYVYTRYLQGMVETAAQQGEFTTILREFIHRYIDLLDRTPALPMFMLREIAEGAPVFKRLIVELGGGMRMGPLTHLVEFFNRGRREGATADFDPFQTLISVMGACIYFFAGYPIFSELHPKLPKHRKQLVEERKNHVFELVYYGLKPRVE